MRGSSLSRLVSECGECCEGCCEGGRDRGSYKSSIGENEVCRAVNWLEVCLSVTGSWVVLIYFICL